MNEDEESAKAILSELLYITLATVSSDGLPWNTPVFAALKPGALTLPISSLVRPAKRI